MPHYNCTITETLGKSWVHPGTSTRKFNYDGKVNMDGYFDSSTDSTRSWSCSKK
jgi:hypothetical protein